MSYLNETLMLAHVYILATGRTFTPSTLVLSLSLKTNQQFTTMTTFTAGGTHGRFSGVGRFPILSFACM